MTEELNKMIGKINRYEETVTNEMTAAKVDSGTLCVLATPFMIARMEKVSYNLIGEYLPQGFGSVGVHIDVKHIAPTAVGDKAIYTAELIGVDNKKFIFKLEAFSEYNGVRTKIGEGVHTRIAINNEKFMKNVER